MGKGVNKQIYLGGYEKERDAAEAYDVAALKIKGFQTLTNFEKDRYRALEGCFGNATVEEVCTGRRRTCDCLFSLQLFHIYYKVWDNIAMNVGHAGH
jgi:hypothetical protein